MFEKIVQTAFGAINVRVFTTSGTYTPTPGTNRVFIECVGGGGAGGGGTATGAGQNSMGSGGGGGAYAAKFLSTGFAGKSYVVGAGGTGVSAGTGNPGGDTTFDSTVVVAKGGAGGSASGVSAGIAFGANGGVGGLASGSTGDETISGSSGLDSVMLAVGVIEPGRGGVAPKGGNGGFTQLNTSTAGNNIMAPTVGGGGAGGGNLASQSANSGGAGATGVIRIWEFA